MAYEKSEDLASYYKQELSYLRAQGADFADRYPKVAARLALDGAESHDPHTERLIESVAFLAARVRRDMDQDLPALALGVLENVCPSLVQPLPSMTVAQFTLDPSQGKVTSGFEVPEGTSLYAKTLNNEECRFTTACPATLWPLHIVKAELDSDDVLRVELACNENVVFSELEIDSLCMHLQGDLSTSMAWYDALVADVQSIKVRPIGGQAHKLPLKRWRQLGFDNAYQTLPVPKHAQPAMVLLQEYFAFPRKFHFFEISGLKGLLGTGQRCELLFQLNRSTSVLRKVCADNFALGCVPIVNVFTKTSEPLLVDHKQYEYLIVADRHRDSDTQVHSILKVTASDPSQDKPTELLQFNASGYMPNETGAPLWSARRQTSLRPRIAGTDVFLSFVDAQRATRSMHPTVIYAQVLCTNRRLAEQVPRRARLVVEGPAQPTLARVLYEPSLERDPPLESDVLWRLHSLLTLNHLSLLQSGDGLMRLRELLGLFASESQRDRVQIKAIASIDAHGMVAHIGQQSWRGFCRGTQINLEFDEASYVGGSSLLMSAVLAHFFAMYTAMNSFVRVAAVRGGEVRKQWEPMTGRQLVL